MSLESKPELIIHPDLPVLNNVIDLASGRQVGNELVYESLTNYNNWLYVMYGESSMGKSELEEQWKERTRRMKSELGLNRPVRFHDSAQIIDDARRAIRLLKRPFQTDTEVTYFSDYLKFETSPYSDDVGFMVLPLKRVKQYLIDLALSNLTHAKKARVFGFIGAPSIQNREIERRRKDREEKSPLEEPIITVERTTVAQSLHISRGSSRGGLDPKEIEEVRDEVFKRGEIVLKRSGWPGLEDIDLPEPFNRLSFDDQRQTLLRILTMSYDLTSFGFNEDTDILLSPDLNMKNEQVA
jgi:hypothetical protein